MCFVNGIKFKPRLHCYRSGFFIFNLFHIYFAVSVVEFERVDAVWHYSEKRFLNFQIYLFLLFYDKVHIDNCFSNIEIEILSTEAKEEIYL